MRFRSITLTHPRIIYGGNSVSFLSIDSNEQSKRVDAIVADGHWVVIAVGGEQRAIPASAVEHGVVLGDQLGAPEKPQPGPRAKAR